MPKLSTHKITCYIVSKVHKSFILTKELRWKCVTVVYQLVQKHLIAYSLHFLIQFTPTQRIIFHKKIWNFTFDSSLITVVLFRYLFPRTILIQPSRLVSIRHLYIINVKKILSLTFTYKIYTVSQKVFFLFKWGRYTDCTYKNQIKAKWDSQDRKELKNDVLLNMHSINFWIID